jgi:hypothetical protein
MGKDEEGLPVVADVDARIVGEGLKRDFGERENLFDGAFGGDGGALGGGDAGGKRDAVGENGHRQSLHIVGRRVVASIDKRHRLGRAVERLGATRAHAQR